MDKKKILLIGLGCVLMAAVLMALLLSGREPGSPVGSAGAAPAVQEQTRPTLPVQTTAPDTTEPVLTLPTETADPEKTEPGETDPEETEPEETEPIYTKPDETEPPVYETPELFPAELEGGLLTVRSIFQFTGMNPDAEDLFGEDVAGIQMTNNSDEHMTWAEVTAVLADGTTLTFWAEDVPPGMSVMAFSLEHESLPDADQCEEIFGYAEFEGGDPLRRDLVQCTVSGTEITVRNVSGGDLTNLDIICHGLLDDSCFGGTTYRYTISTLPAGASTVVHAVDCILGMAQVVRVELGG